jgi:pyridoxamine 5'-phosphate oxidase
MSASLTDAALAAGDIPDPFDLFAAWLAEAGRSEPNDPNAMALATVDASGLPDVRMVLLKGHDRRGFVFYTNLRSAKGEELAGNPKAALLFHWKSLRRQVRVRGPVSPVDAAEADAYFASRPRGSRIGAWASDQSRPARDRAELEARVAEREAQFPDVVPRPPHWSGFRVRPERIEFWQDGAFRLHDRFAYVADGDGWHVARLFP